MACGVGGDGRGMGHVRVQGAIRFARAGDQANGVDTNTVHSPSELHRNLAIFAFKSSVTYTSALRYNTYATELLMFYNRPQVLRPRTFMNARYTHCREEIFLSRSTVGFNQPSAIFVASYTILEWSEYNRFTS